MTKVSQTNIWLTSYGKDANNPEWFEFYLEPKINSPGNAYFGRIISRSPVISGVINNTKKLPEIIKKITEMIIQKKSKDLDIWICV